MPDFQGRFVWYELMTSDTAGAKTFYADVVGWRAEAVPMPGMDYTLLHAGEPQVAGLMPIPADAAAMNAPPSWIGYVAVADVDASASQAASLGGQVLKTPDDIPNVGRFAVVADPHGATLALFRGLGEGPMDPESAAPGHVGWHELYAGDLEPAFAFYSAMFGWKKLDAMDMGEMGTYQIYGVGDVTLGGMMTKPANMPTPSWLFYVNVPDIDAAQARVTAGGGQVLNGPMQVPTGDWIIQGQDPQGAMFALVGKRP